MVDLLDYSLAKPLLAAGPELTHSISNSNSDQLDPAALNRVVVRWSEPLQIEEQAQRQCNANCLTAMQRLVKRIAQLRSTDDGSATATPQALLALVTQEAEEVLVQSAQKADPTKSEAIKVESSALEAPITWCVGSLAPHLLWEIARSTHEVVRLIEGIPARISEDGEPWNSGILRLVTALELKRESTVYCFDLVTFEKTAAVAPEYQVQIQAGLLGQHPVAATVLLQQLTAQILRATPTLSRFFEGFGADWLVPYQDWQIGSLKLRLGLEFLPEAVNSSNGHLINNSPQPLIKFTQATWLEQHITTAVEDQLTQVLRQIPPIQSDLPQVEVLAAIVQQGCVAIDQLQCSLALASRTFAQQTLPLEDLGLRLLWGINRTAYEVMQFISGIRVQVLQPQQAWSTGALRFVVCLTVRTPEHNYQFDLARRSWGLSFLPLAATAIVQTSEDVGYSQPIALSQLETVLWQHINQGAPEVSLLRSGTEVIVSTNDSQEFGVIQLETAFEFTPDPKQANEIYRHAPYEGQLDD